MPKLPSTGSATPQGIAEAIAGLAELCTAVAALLEQFPGIRRSADVEKALGLDGPLAWRVFRVATAVEPSNAVQYLPTMNQLQRVLAAARTRGASGDSAERVERAIAGFDSAVREVAGDHASFCSLVSAHSQEGLERIDMRIRRQTFRGNAHLWGLQCRTNVCALIVHPSDDGETLRAFTIRGLVDLEAGRTERPLVLMSRFSVVRNLAAVEEEVPQIGEMRMLKEFGGSDRLDIRNVDAGDGTLETHVRVPDVGRAGRSSLFLGSALERVGLVREPEPHRLSTLVCTPAEVLHFEFVTPAGWADPEKTGFSVYARSNDVQRARDRRPIDRIRTYETPSHLLDVDNVPPTPDIPKWPDSMRSILKQRGLWGRRLDVYRVRVPYPMLHSCPVLEVIPRGAPSGQ